MAEFTAKKDNSKELQEVIEKLQDILKIDSSSRYELKIKALDLKNYSAIIELKFKIFKNNVNIDYPFENQNNKLGLFKQENDAKKKSEDQILIAYLKNDKCVQDKQNFYRNTGAIQSVIQKFPKETDFSPITKELQKLAEIGKCYEISQKARENKFLLINAVHTITNEDTKWNLKEELRPLWEAFSDNKQLLFPINKEIPTKNFDYPTTSNLKTKENAFVVSELKTKENAFEVKTKEINELLEISTSSSTPSSSEFEENSLKIIETVSSNKNKKIFKKCKFCLRNGETNSIVKSHNLFTVDGEVECKFLRDYECIICGEKSHTKKYCQYYTDWCFAKMNIENFFE